MLLHEKYDIEYFGALNSNDDSNSKPSYFSKKKVVIAAVLALSSVTAAPSTYAAKAVSVREAYLFPAQVETLNEEKDYGKMSPSDQVREIKNITGLGWYDLGSFFGVNSLTVKSWAKGMSVPESQKEIFDQKVKYVISLQKDYTSPSEIRKSLLGEAKHLEYGINLGAARQTINLFPANILTPAASNESL